MSVKYPVLYAFVFAIGICDPVFAGEEQQQQKQQDAKGLDMVSDTVASVFNKANALLTGNLEITMSKDSPDTEDQYTRNALGQKVPKSTAVKSAGSSHNDEPL